MRTRLAMVACYGPHDGPWLRVRGNETGLRVSHLGQGELVFVDFEKDSLQETFQVAVEGEFPCPPFDRIRFRKAFAGKPTTVEIVVAN